MTPQRLSPLQLMEKLISFPTVSRDSNLDLVDWVQTYLQDHGITAHRFYNDAGDKAALFAHVGPMVEGGIVLSGHTDVVPVDGQNWSSDPWVVTERDGRYFGRGTCDMKGFDALALWALVEAQHMGVARPLQIALSFDEEVGCTGAPPMIEAMLQTLPKASAVIVGEPSMMKAVSGHKGGIGITTTLVGHEVHSSLIHQGVNAIMFGAKLVDWANKVNAETWRAARGLWRKCSIRLFPPHMWAPFAAARRKTSPPRNVISSWGFGCCPTKTWPITRRAIYSRCARSRRKCRPSTPMPTS